MRLAFYIVTAVVVLGAAYTLGPDFVRYLKIRSM
jgi:hypothetical protein